MEADGTTKNLTSIRSRATSQDSPNLSNDSSSCVSPVAGGPTGLRVLEAPELDLFEAAFQEGMAARAERLGDKQDQELGAEDGHARPGDQHSHEHFGFRDGISQSGFAGITTELKPGQEMIPAGEFSTRAVLRLSAPVTRKKPLTPRSLTPRSPTRRYWGTRRSTTSSSTLMMRMATWFRGPRTFARCTPAMRIRRARRRVRATASFAAEFPTVQTSSRQSLLILVKARRRTIRIAACSSAATRLD
jgi:hypothetical protein